MHPRHLFRQPSGRIAKRRDVRGKCARVGMEAGVAIGMGFFKGPESHFTTTPEERVVGANIELDLVGADVRFLPIHGLPPM